MDERRASYIVLQDLCEVSNTVDHDILLECFQSSLSIGRNALSWFRSYLTDRNQMVMIGDFSTSLVCMRLVVSQGSVIGLMLFSIWKSSLR